jgi:hypothetical protein
VRYQQNEGFSNKKQSEKVRVIWRIKSQVTEGKNRIVMYLILKIMCDCESNTGYDALDRFPVIG